VRCERTNHRDRGRDVRSGGLRTESAPSRPLAALTCHCSQSCYEEETCAERKVEIGDRALSVNCHGDAVWTLAAAIRAAPRTRNNAGSKRDEVFPGRNSFRRIPRFAQSLVHPRPQPRAAKEHSRR